MKRSPSSSLGRHLTIALLLAACFPLRHVMRGREMPFLANALHQHYPGQIVLSRLLAASPRRLPSWDPYQFCGSPLLADPRRQAYYPPAVLYRLLPFPRAYGWFLAAHVLLGLAGMAALLVARGLGPRGAMLGAIGFALGVHATLLQSSPPELCAMGWLPWIALFALRLSAGDLRGGALGLAMSGGWLMLAGAPVTVVLAVALVAVILLGEPGEGRGRKAAAAGAGGLGALLIASAVFIPLLAYLPDCARGGWPARLPPGTGSVAPWDLLGLIVPRLFLTGAAGVLDDPTIFWATLHAPGILILGLAAAGWWLRRGEAAVRTPLRLVAVGLVLGMGPWIPVLGRLLEYIWPFSQLRHPGLWMEISGLGLAWLAGVGAHEVEARIGSPAARRVREGWLVVAVFLGSLGVGSHVWQLGAPAKFIEGRWGAYAIAFAARLGLATDAAMLLVLGSTALWLASRREISAAWAIRFIGFLAFLETGLGAGEAFQPKLPAARLMAPSGTEISLATALPERTWGRVFVTPHHQIARAEQGEGTNGVADNWRASFRSNLPAAGGFRDASGDNPLKPAGTDALLESVTHAPHTPWDAAAKRVFDLLGVRVLITRSTIAGDGMTLVHHDHVQVYRRAGTLRPVWVTPDGAGTVVSALSVNAGEWVVRVRMRQPGTLVLAESSVNGWKVASGPPGAVVTRALDALVAVDLPAGSHVINLVYDPVSVKLGLALSLLAGVGLAILGLRRGARRRPLGATSYRASRISRTFSRLTQSSRL